MALSSSTPGVELLSKYQVFINFRGVELRESFVIPLTSALKKQGIKVFMDKHLIEGEDIKNLFKKIEESRIALVIFSKRYAESKWCLDELVKINERVNEERLVAIPIFYKVETSDVKERKHDFGDKFKIMVYDCNQPRVVNNWENALKSISGKIGIVYEEKGVEEVLFSSIIEAVKRVVTEISSKELEISKTISTGGNTEKKELDEHLVGIEQRVKQLEDKLVFKDETCIVGVVGMPGIGKTALAKNYYNSLKLKFERSIFFAEVSKMSKVNGLSWLQKSLLEELLKDTSPDIGFTKNAHQVWKDELLKMNVCIVLDDVNEKEEIQSLLGNLDWIKKGSIIVITTSDKSLLQNLVNYTYVVPRLNDKHSLQYFVYHASGPNSPPQEKFLRLSRKVLGYAKGNPLVIKELGVELGKEEDDWEQRVETLTKSSSPKIHDALSKRYKELSEKQKDAFLDIACFFRSETTSYVRSMVDSCNSGVIDDLTDKFLLSIHGDRVEMHDVLYTFGKELASRVSCRLWNHEDIVRMLKHKLDMEKVRGVFLDMSEVEEKMSFDTNNFTSMCSLRYLKIYSSICPMECKADQIIDVPEGLQFTLAEVRCLYWLKFPLHKLPSDFNVKNLVDLSLPYSSIKQVWEGAKNTPNLKSVDLSHSLNLSDLSGLSDAQNLERLNLEGCTKLVTLPKKMGNMKSLLFLNMRGCMSLRNLPKANLSSLKVLILSDCSEFQEFQVISENLETLYLDGTALGRLPPAIGSLQRLAVLNLRGCKALEHLSGSLGKLNALEDLILSGCSNLQSFPMDTKNMKHLRILLVDGTTINQIPMILQFKDSLQRLCLSGNSLINLPANIEQLYRLKWLDLKNCENLTDLPTLPPNLECLDAHGCHRLVRVMDPLAIAFITEQFCSTFIFTNCTNLEEDARNTITSYAEWKFQLHAFKCYDMGLVSQASFKTCFPGCEVPLWFQHQDIGSVLETRLQPNWCDHVLSGIALCAVVSFQDKKQLIDCFSVKCTLELKDDSDFCISSHFKVGSWTGPGETDTDHVFIGYASFSKITKHLKSKYSSKCVPATATLNFNVTDGKGEVVKCGFNLVYVEPNNLLSKAKSSSGQFDWVGKIIGCLIIVLICAAVSYPVSFLKISCSVVAVYNFFWTFFLQLKEKWNSNPPRREQELDSLQPEGDGTNMAASGPDT